MTRRVVEQTLLEWLDEGRRVVIAQLIEIDGSAPLDTGATMLICEDGRIEGSVTGGCVEAALVDEAQKIFGGEDALVLSYGISDELAGKVGLMCGGAVQILLSEAKGSSRDALASFVDAIEAETPAAIATVVDGPTAGSQLVASDDQVVGTLSVADLLDRSVARDARGLLVQGLSMVRSYGSDGAVMGDDLRVFIKSHAQRPRMVIFGAIDFSVALARLAGEAGYRVTICDARKPFISSSRFSEAAELVSEWPDAYLEGREFDARDALLVFTHDPKFDEPALISALQTGAGYIGALGSRRTDSERRERLRQAGVTPDELERVVSPCGLDIGSSTPIETAIAILAEITALRTGRAGERLVDTTGSIRRHPQTQA